MRNGITISAILHVGVIALAVLGLPHWWRRPAPVMEDAVVVELVKVADVTTPQVKAKPEPKPEPVQQEVKAAEPPPEPPKPEPPPAPPPPVEAKEPPPPPPPPPAPEPVTLPEPKPEPPKPAPPKPEVAKVEAPKPEPKPEPPKPTKQAEKKPEPPPPRPVAKAEPDEPEFDPNRIAALLDKSAKAAPRRSEQAEKPATKKPQPAPMEQVARRLGEELTISEVDAIRAQIQRCWSVPAGARDAEDLTVRIKVFLRPDGSLARPPEIVDQYRMSLSGQEFFRAAAESAVRAVRKCNPLRDLPQDKYERWRELTLTFDPKEMVNG